MARGKVAAEKENGPRKIGGKHEANGKDRGDDSLERQTARERPTPGGQKLSARRIARELREEKYNDPRKGK